ELAPGVAVTGRSQRELLAALRKAGEAPLAEEPAGSPRPEGARPVRHVQRAAPDRLSPAGAVPNCHAAAGPGMDPATLRARPARPLPRAAPDRLDPAGAVPNGHAADGPGMDPATVVDRLRGRRPVPATGTDQRVARGWRRPARSERPQQ